VLYPLPNLLFLILGNIIFGLRRMLNLVIFSLNLLIIPNKFGGINTNSAPDLFIYREEKGQTNMSKLQIFPIIVNDYVPFMIITLAYNKKQALSSAKTMFPTLFTSFDLDKDDIDVLFPIKLEQGNTFVIDPEMYLIDNDNDLEFWLGENGKYYDDNSEKIDLKDLAKNGLDKIEEEKSVKLLPETISSENSGEKCESNPGKTTDNSIWI